MDTNVILVALLVVFLFITLRILIKVAGFRGSLTVDEAMTILDLPITVHKSQLSKSKVGDKRSSSRITGDLDLIFVTNDVQALLISQHSQPQLEAQLSYTPSSPSSKFSPGEKWELCIFCTLYNSTNIRLSVYDIHAHVYHVATHVRPLLMIGWAPRVELTQDNSILTQGKRFLLDSSEEQALELVLETSLYDTLDTAIIFGLYVDYQLYHKHQVKKYRIPSNHIYVFQHNPRRYKGCHFVSRNSFTIQEAAKAAGGYKKTFDSLLKMYEMHIGQGRVSLP
jgi:hypothetical protein